MTIEGQASAEAVEQIVDSQVTETPESQDAGDLSHLADTSDDFHPEESGVEATPTPEPVISAQPELPPEVKVRLQRLDQYERSQLAQQALEYEAQQKQLIENQRAQEQAETRALALRMEEMGFQAQALAEAGRIEEARNMRAQALHILNEHNQNKAEERLVTKIQAAQSQHNQAQQQFAQDVEAFMQAPGWKDFCDPRKPEESRKIAMWATDLKLNKGYSQNAIYQMLCDNKALFGGNQQRPSAQQTTETAARTRAQAGMESPSGAAPESRRENDLDKKTDAVMGMWFGRRPKT